MESTDIVRGPGTGRALVTLTATVRGSEGRPTGSARAALRIAPLLTMNHTQRVTRLILSPGVGVPSLPLTGAKKPAGAPATSGTPATSGAPSPAEVDATKVGARIARETGDLARRVHLRDGRTVLGTNDLWAQDYMEPMYVSMPAPGGRTQSITLIMRSHQNRASSAFAFQLQGRDVGVVRVLPAARAEETVNSFGNWETIPPYRLGGHDYPAGRVIVGQRGPSQQPSKALLRLIRAQGLQAPILLNTRWLDVGHVDEFVQFVPAPGTARGWTIAVSDPRKGLELLRQVQAAGGGAQHVTAPAVPDPRLARADMARNPDAQRVPTPAPTVDQALANPSIVSTNEKAAQLIDENLAVLMRATGVTPDEVLRIPAVYEDSPYIDDAMLAKQIAGMRSMPGFAKLPKKDQDALLEGVQGGDLHPHPSARGDPRQQSHPRRHQQRDADSRHRPDPGPVRAAGQRRGCVHAGDREAVRPRRAVGAGHRRHDHLPLGPGGDPLRIQHPA